MDDDTIKRLQWEQAQLSEWKAGLQGPQADAQKIREQHAALRLAASGKSLADVFDENDKLLAALEELAYAINLYPDHPDWVSENFKGSLLIAASNKACGLVNELKGKS